ncbi:sensor histidine kinase [Caldanaerobius polysaccharolyticus]|uniref:sensor histidine kinase n=1 Tax=Caldanaerobius polysaccharolyticus TaxID=44256 RepID=UPI00047C407C|nr:ATP-binding protein [Caldanaerobius polysaccharolyticus]
MYKLRTRLILLISGSTIFSIVLVSLITNITLFNKFNIYMMDEQENRIRELIQLIENSYSINNRWTEEAYNNIKLSPLMMEFDVTIKDVNGNTVFRHHMVQEMAEMHKNMMKEMGKSMGGMNPNGMMDHEIGKYVTKTYTLTSNGRIIGTAQIGYIGPFLVTERAIEFTRGINSSIAYAAIISILVAVILGIQSSKVISEPILKIADAANNIRKGELNTKISLNNKVQELQVLSNSINHLARSLSEQEALRKRLTSDISHELRTPLTILQSHIEAISDGIWEPTPERLEVCKNEVMRLIKLVEQLRHLTDIENDDIKLNVKKFSMTELLNEIVDSFEYHIASKGIKLKRQIKDNVFIEGDRDKVSQVVINIISNAIKYTDSGGFIKVELEEGIGDVYVSIQDSGIGIPKEDLPYIFERFYRSDRSRSRKTGGAGIGLTIAKTLVKAHRGDITVESEEGKGTKFVVKLPKIYY